MTKNIFKWTFLPAALFLTCCKKPDFATKPTARDVGTINQYLNNNFDFSLFAAAVQKIGFADSLDVITDSFTVFAPTNEALNKEGVYTPSDFDHWPADSLAQFVKIHILHQKLFFDNIPTTPDTRYTDLAGIELYLTSTGYALEVDGVGVQANSYLGSYSLSYGSAEINGLVYPLPSTIKASSATVTDFLSGRSDFTCLIAGLKKFGYWDKLQGQGPFTVFAPQDSIFIKRGLTVDSINRMDTAHFAPVVFGGYFLASNHIYIWDMRNLPSGAIGNDIATFPSPDPNYDLMIAQQYVYNGVGVVTNASAQTSNPVFVGPNATAGYSSQGTPFLGEGPLPSIFPVGTYVNYTFSNGVVHLMADINVMPNLVEK